MSYSPHLLPKQTRRRNDRRRDFEMGFQIEVLQSRELLSATNFADVAFLDGETNGPAADGPLLNRFGGGTVAGTNATTAFETETVRTGNGALRIQTNGTITTGTSDFIQLALAGQFFDYVDTRDLSHFDELRFWMRNGTGSELELAFEIKDHLNSQVQKAELKLPTVSASTDWIEYVVPLDFADDAWTISGTAPDLTRARFLGFIIKADYEDVSGSLYIDDMILHEKGGNLNPTSAQADQLLNRVIARQFRGIWGSRDRTTGLVPNISAQADIMTTNATGGLIQMLPEAIQRGLVSPTEANIEVGLVVQTMNTAWDQVEADNRGGGFLPPRTLDRVSLTRTNVGGKRPTTEESPVDAAFLFLALDQYRRLSTTPEALRNSINQFLGRFDFSVFSTPGGAWNLAYVYGDEDFSPHTYRGFSGEGQVISLAAHLAPNNSVDITEHWNSAIDRESAFLVNPEDAHIVNTDEIHRGVFLQWLFHLFADVSNRGVDSFEHPVTGSTEFATNSYDNAVLFQREVHAALLAMGRRNYLQPDAADDGRGVPGSYQQYSLYNNFGQPGLFMPWSVGFSVLGDRAFALPALRDLLRKDLHGPLGLVDSVVIPTGQSNPTRQPARQDYWNLALSTMALMTATSSSPSNTSYAQYPDVSAAFDSVFPNAVVTLPDGGGDYEVLRTGGDLVVRISGGAELLRRAHSEVSSLSITGAAGNDRVTVLNLGTAVDTPIHFQGNAGHDRFTGTAGTGPMTLSGGVGNDLLIGGTNDDNLSGNDGADTLRGNSGNDTAIGGNGTDIVYAGKGRDSISGGPHNDRLFGDNGYDTISGGTGNDFLRGGRGRDRMTGDDGHDRLIGDDHNDVLAGGLRNDTITGGNGNDTVYAGDGRDSVDGDAGRDRLFGNNGYDTLRGGTGEDFIRGGRGRDRIFGDDQSGNGDNDEIFGDDHNDTITGGGGNDTIMGGSGNDIVYAGNGQDQVNGDAGIDKLFGNDGGDTITGGLEDDFLRGGAGNDQISGGGGNDQLLGDQDDDTLLGGSGTDSLTGGSGSDFANGEAGADIIDVKEAPQPDGIDTVVGGDMADTIFTDPGDVVMV